MKSLSKDIFISYRREDGYLFANVLAEKLTARGYSVFYDRADLVVGSVFPERLTQAVLECHDFVSVVSPMYLGAVRDGRLRIESPEDWVRQEIRLAMTGRKQLLPILINLEGVNVPLPEDIREFSNHNFLRYDQESTIDEFVTLLEKGFSEATVENRKYNTLLRELYAISDESDNNFNIKIRNFIISRNEEVVEEKLIPLIVNREAPEDVCFAAYYAAFTFYRRMGYAYKIHDLVERFGQRFENYRFNNVALSQHYSLRFELEGKKPEDLRRATQAARRAAELIPDNAGVMQNFADLITKSFELGVCHDRTMLAQAVERIHRAMELNPKYPKYHCTLGRLLSFQGRYDEAVVSIQRAINLENSETKDSFIRIMDYNRYITDIKLRQLEHKLLLAVGITAVSLAGLLAAVAALYLR